ncbi:MAG: chloride channel protein [Actinomycetes bacterium]
MWERVRHLTGPHRVLVLSVVVGGLVGLAVAALEQVVGRWILGWTLDLPPWPRTLAPAVGLLLTWLILRFVGRGASPATADEYLHSFHNLDGEVVPAVAPAKFLGVAASLGSGVALGFEGPAIYLGSLIGGLVGRGSRRLLRPEDRRTLLVAGSAAGVAAIFKTPATGAIFALEVPYHDDIASNAIGPSILAAASGYVVFALFFGFDRLFPISGGSPLHAGQMAGAIVLGLAAGLGARGFAALEMAAKWVNAHLPAWVRLLASGGALVGLGALTWVVYAAPLSMGTGELAIDWSQTAVRSLVLLALLAGIRILATASSLAGGAVGGVFVPLVAEGWLLGAMFAVIVHDHSLLYEAIGAAAFLGAGYRVPIAGIVFVAESTGRPGFIVPALLATAVAQLAMGNASVTHLQRRSRHDRIDHLMEEPIATALVRVARCAPGDPLAEVVTRGRFVAVVDAGRYVGLVDRGAALDVLVADPAARVSLPLPVSAAVGPVGAPNWSIGRTRDLFGASPDDVVEVVPVCDGPHILGVVTPASLLARTRPPED